MLEISAQELKQLWTQDQTVRIIDVRTPEEFSENRISTAINIPTDEVQDRVAEFKSDQPTYIICRSGSRSKLVTLTLSSLGVERLYNVAGGMLAWNTNPESPLNPY